MIGLNAVNFLAAELASVIGPFLAVYLKEKGWSYSQIGLATAAGGFGMLLAQAPAGYIVDVFSNRKLLLTVTSLTLGIGFALVPLTVDHSLLVTSLLFITGVAGSFLVPLLATVALSLVPPQQFARITGETQSWNHAGNIAAAVLALIIVKSSGVGPVFFMLAVISVLTVMALRLIKDSDLENKSSAGAAVEMGRLKLIKYLYRFARDSQTQTLVLAVMLFHLANTPGLPLVGLYVKKMGGADTFVGWAVLIAQGAMIPVAFLTGAYAEKFGRKPMFILAFAVLILRYGLYVFLTDQTSLLVIQVLDGVGAGIYGVIIALICRDLTAVRGGFNLLMGVTQTALALGTFFGPLMQGFLIDALGFKMTFLALSGFAIVGVALFSFRFRETHLDLA